MKPKHLILFTSNYPYGKGEPFLETEINFLSGGFEKITIVTQNAVSAEMREVPENCEVVRKSFEVDKAGKLKALNALFSPMYMEERKNLKAIGLELNSGVFKTLLISLYRAKMIRNYVRQLQEANKVYENYYYSYWGDDVSIALAMFRKERSDVRCFTRVHGWDVYFEASEVGYLPFRRFIAKYLDAIFTISDAGKKYCLNRWKAELPEKIQVSRLGVKTQKQLSDRGEPFTVVSCSNVIPLKRIHLIVEALAELPEEIKLNWIHFGDGPELEKVRTMAKKLLSAQVSFEFKGHCSNTELLEWYRNESPDLFINVSSTEGIPVSIMEAMSFGIPAIATNVGGTGEIVDAENGILLPSNPEVQEISDAISHFYSLSTEQMDAYRNAAYHTWNEKYNAERNYREFTALITEL